MLRLLAVCALLTIALSMLDQEFDFGGQDESALEILMREQGFSDVEIEVFLQQDRSDREELETQEEEEYFSWDEAKGYDECDEFRHSWRRKDYVYGKKEDEKEDELKEDGKKYELKEDDWTDMKKAWAGDYTVVVEEKEEEDVVDQPKADGSSSGYHGSRHHGRSSHHGSSRHHGSSGRSSHHGSSRHHGSSSSKHHGSSKYHGKSGPHGKSGYHSKSGYHGKSGKKRGNCKSKPKPLDQICAEIECPVIEKLNISGCGFEARKVLSANWIVTPFDTSDMRTGYQNAFWRLFKYISGANEQGAKIAMTAPVITQWILDEEYELEGAVMAFYIPSAFQANPPAPTDPLVHVAMWTDAIIYDRAFGGTHDDPEYYKRQFTSLWRALAKENITPYTKMSVTAGYTRPGWGRQRMEVMFVDAGSM
ncbi:uncharacterized protein LOC134824952 [Bolinopsis microptera]|uniref:uncharacterized protein LOC134824952 n=1 Tax=Bolinopsis microptera TaxID=2820187 RepID=UPI00307A43D0